jgi:glucose/arabinose dehydrogenase
MMLNSSINGGTSGSTGGSASNKLKNDPKDPGMLRRFRAGRATLLLLLCAAVLAGCTQNPPAGDGGPNVPPPGEPVQPGPVPLKLETVIARGLQAPLGMEVANDGSGRLFIVEKGGLIRIFQDGQLLEEPFLDVSSLIRTENERGLLGLAFHPDYANNGRLFVHYSGAARGDGIIAEYNVRPDEPNRADPTSARIVLTVNRNVGDTFHNGGQISFGPDDGYLYIAFGEGPRGNNSQQLGTLLGKILRIDVDSRDVDNSYGIPEDNPFVGQAGARPEIWALGLRNPWRFSFDRDTHDLWIADVGESSWEEVNMQPANSAGGQNYGWRIMEGRHCFTGTGCDQSGLTLPRIEYGHQNSPGDMCSGSVTGGFVYRGSAIPDLQGHYVFGDVCRYTVWTAAVTEGTGPLTIEFAADTGEFMPTSFGQDEAGELYLVGYGLEDDGTLHRLVAE